jgi:sugar/nucleoside kinase (ribokinase family)
MKKYSVFGIGNALVDMEFEVEDAFLNQQGIEKGLMTLVEEERQDELVKSLTKFPVKRQCGGSAANSLFALAQLGGTGFYTCKVSGDDNGSFYLSELKKAGLETNFALDHLPAGKTGRCLVMVTPDAQRTMCTYLGISASLAETEVNLEQLSESEYLYIEGYLVASPTGFKAAMKCVNYARQHGVKIAVTLSDPSMVQFFRAQFDELLSSPVDLLFCNEEEAKIFAQKENLEDSFDVLDDVAKNYVVTVGVDGAHIRTKESTIEVPSYPTTVLDTNGAGDMFAGCFLFGLTSGMSWEQSGHLASMAAAKIVSQFGPRLEQTQMIELLKEFRG